MPKNKSKHREAALAAQKAAWEGTLSTVDEHALAEIIGVSVDMVRLYRDGKNLLPMDAMRAICASDIEWTTVNRFMNIYFWTE